MPEFGPDEVSLLVAGTDFRFWPEMELKHHLDAFSTIGFRAPFDASREEARRLWRPLSYHPIVVQIGGQDHFTGTMLDVDPDVTPEQKTVVVTGYSKPGVLEDCSPPGSKAPFEWDKISLHEIASIVCGWFNLWVEFEGDPGAKFDKVKIEPGTKIHGWLSDLAKQRGYVISNTATGNVRFRQSSKTGPIVHRFEQGKEPLVKISPAINSREYFSEVTGFSPKKRHKPGIQLPVTNPRLSGVVRPHSIKFDETEKEDAAKATNAFVGRMFANAIAYTVDDIPTWRTPTGELWEPGQRITLLAPDAMIYRETELLIRDVTLVRTKDKKAASLSVVLPGAFSGEAPSELPFDV